MSDPTRLRLRDFVPRGSHFHVARGVYASAARRRLHTHDFVEVCWVESGAGVHVVNGERVPLQAGDLLLIRARDAHDFRGGRPQPLTLLNVAFEPDVPNDLRRRYFPRGGFPWHAGRLPPCVRLGRGALARTTEAAERLAQAPQTRLSLDRFLIGVLDEVTYPRRLAATADLPPWLARAVRRFAEDPAQLAAGVGALAALAGRSPAHVNRTFRRHSGQTTTAFVNRLRLDRAALELRLTSKPILEIAIDCGMPNLGYFYRRFGERFDTTPRRYRLRQQAVLGG